MDFSLIGLSIRDKRVYEYLASYPESSLRRVAENTGINRGSVYESIKALVAAGLVTHIITGKRLRYRAKDPEILHEIIREKRRELLDAATAIDSYVASFAGQANDPSRFHFASFYEGDEGLATILRDVLKSCRRAGIDHYRAISSPRISEYLYNNFPHFTRERIRLKLHVSVLRQSTIDIKEAPFAESRLLQSGSVDTGCYTLIYATKVAIVTIDQLNRTSGVIIDDANFAAIQTRLFDVAWR